MSRHYLWEYVIPGEDHVARWDHFFDEFPSYGIPIKYVPTGGSRPEGPSYIGLWANRAKARRIAAKLDKMLGVTAVLRPSSIYEDEDFTGRGPRV